MGRQPKWGRVAVVVGGRCSVISKDTANKDV